MFNRSGALTPIQFIRYLDERIQDPNYKAEDGGFAVIEFLYNPSIEDIDRLRIAVINYNYVTPLINDYLQNNPNHYDLNRLISIQQASMDTVVEVWRRTFPPEA